MPPSPNALEALRRDLTAFVEERDWDKFHSPKDLALGIAVEAGELLENFQWTNPDADALRADEELLARVRAECADVFLYALILADKAGFDLVDAARAKLRANAEKYPVEKARGNARKYTLLD